MIDVLVIGSGAAGLTAALAAHDCGARVEIFEKADVIGGTTAMSGGVAWLPANRFAEAEGIADSPEEAITYLLSLSNGTMDEKMVRTFVETVPELIDWLETATPLRLQLCTIPDYHPEHPGGKPGSGRSLEPGLFAFEELGELADHVATGQYSDRETGDVYLLSGETPRGGGSGRIPEEDMVQRRRRRINGRGRALAGGLLKACLDRDIPIHRLSRVVDLLTEGQAITGVMVEGAEGRREVVASRGVVIASGGFEWDDQLTRAFLRGPMELPATIPSNTGDGLKMAMKAGAALGAMGEAWWVPVLAVPNATSNGGVETSLVLRERSLPGSIMVNRKGKRFCNEATNYNAIAGAFHQFDPGAFEYANLPCWLVFDQAYVDRYGFWQVPPGGAIPEWVRRAGTPEVLGAAAGFDGAALRVTLTHWNTMVAADRDVDFWRGDSAYDGWNGDISCYPSRSATLGKIEASLLYAVELHSSVLGTKGGPQTDVDARVLDMSGDPIRGLFAAGNAMAAPTGMAYGGAGGTLGPALVFGYRAGRAAALGNR
jgi:3-oxosteroid 1-dehydrogenase